MHSGQNSLLNALSLCSSGLGMAAPAPRWTGQAHAMRQLSCVPVTPFCHWDVSAANSGANYLLAMAPSRAKALTYDGEETSPYSYLIMTWIAHMSMFRPCLPAKLQFWAVDSPASLISSVTAKDLTTHRIWGDGEKKERNQVFVSISIIFGITIISLQWRFGVYFHFCFGFVLWGFLFCFILGFWFCILKNSSDLLFSVGNTKKKKTNPNPTILKKGRKRHGKERL